MCITMVIQILNPFCLFIIIIITIIDTTLAEL